MADGLRTCIQLAPVQQALPMSLIEQLLQLLIDPQYRFPAAGDWPAGPADRMTHPGAWVPAFFGVVCLSLARTGWASCRSTGSG